MSLILWLAVFGMAPEVTSSSPLTVASASAFVQPQPPVTLSAASSADEVLLALQKRGDGLKDFEAEVSLAETDDATGDNRTRTGKVWFHQNPGDPSATLRVLFDKWTDGDTVRPERIEYLLDGLWLIDRNYRKKSEVKRKVLRPGEKINLLKLGEGPFPLPIGQDPTEVKRQFNVSALPAEGDKPGVSLVPIAGTRLATKFARIDVWVDTRTNFPSKIVTVTPSGSSSRTTTLTGLRVNPEGGLAPNSFTLPPIDGQWSVTEEQYQD